MRIRYVVSTMVFWWRENKLSFEQECEFIKSMGFGVELWPYIKGQNECRYDRRNWERLTNATEGMLVSMYSRDHGPTIEEWQEQIECAQLLNAHIITDLHSFGISENANLDDCHFSADIVEMAKQHDVQLCLETGDLRKVQYLGEKFDSLFYCFDTGFAHMDREHTFEEYVDELASRVAHLHLTDSYGDCDDHEPPGVRGGIPKEKWDYLLNALDRFDNDVIGSLEMSPCMPNDMIRHASKFLFDVMKWPDKPQKIPGQNVNYNPV